MEAVSRSRHGGFSGPPTGMRTWGCRASRAAGWRPRWGRGESRCGNSGPGVSEVLLEEIPRARPGRGVLTPVWP